MKRLPLVDRLRVRSPCDVRWDAMDDFGAHRRCTRCEMTVHDVASMSRVELDALLEVRERGERVCLFLQVRKSDGAILVAETRSRPRASRRRRRHHPASGSSKRRRGRSQPRLRRSQR
jgi:hypothetical protein